MKAVMNIITQITPITERHCGSTSLKLSAMTDTVVKDVKLKWHQTAMMKKKKIKQFVTNTVLARNKK